MTSNNLITRAVLALAATLVPLAAEGAISRAVSFDEKVGNAASVIVGKCLRTEARWDPSGRFILTYATFQVERALKGQPTSQMTVVVPGGKVGNVYQDSAGIPSFEAGDERVLFIRDSSVGPTVAFFDQGTYDLVRDARGERMVRPVFSEAVYVDTQRGVAVPAESPRPLRQFERDIRDAEARHAKNRMAVLEKQKQKKEQESSLRAGLQRNKLLVLLALAGAVLATWQYLRR
ncbi:MAG: hypothetical protein WA208_01170 [Thermoanaerobaculia bacterium]